MSCFFYDGPSSSPPSPPATTASSHVASFSTSLDQFSSSAHRGVLTNRSGAIEPFRRKVIQYVPYADMFDELGASLCFLFILSTIMQNTRELILSILSDVDAIFSFDNHNKL